MYEKTAAFYDAIYDFKDYAAEAGLLRALIAEHQAPGNTLLDVACGTGSHLAHLLPDFAVSGLDLDAGMLAVARRRLPQVSFYQGDMINFALGQRFDVVTCLFSSIGYARSLAAMRQALKTMRAHLNPGGLLIVEPWFSQQEFEPGRLSGIYIDKPELKLARINLTEVVDNCSVIEFHYLVGTPGGVESLRERHVLGLFTVEQYLEAFEAAGLPVIHDPQGISGRGLYLGRETG